MPEAGKPDTAEGYQVRFMKAAVRLLAFEQFAELPGPTIRGVHLWPVVRAGLMNHVAHKTVPAATPTEDASILSSMRVAANCVVCDTLPNTHAPNGLLKIGSVRDMTVNGRQYNIFTDPFMEGDPRRKNYFKMASEPDGQSKYFYPSVRPFWHSEAGIVRFSREEIDGLAELLAKAHTFFGLKLPLSQILRSFAYIESLAGCLRRFFVQRKVETVRYNCFYHSMALSVNLAAHGTDTLSIDHQHGQQGRYHFMYTHWGVFPSGGYALLPKVFEVWGDRYAANLGRWFGGGCGHEVRVLRNLWLDKNRHRDGIPVWRDYPELRERAAGRKIVLLALQPIEPALPAMFPEAMQRTADSHFWIIRPHPGNSSQDMEVVQKALNNLPSHMWAVPEACSMNLFDAIGLADIVLTRYSTVAVEGVYMDRPTIVVDSYAREIYDDFIESGQMRYAANADELCVALCTDATSTVSI